MLIQLYGHLEAVVCVAKLYCVVLRGVFNYSTLTDINGVDKALSITYERLSLYVGSPCQGVSPLIAYSLNIINTNSSDNHFHNKAIH